MTQLTNLDISCNNKFNGTPLAEIISRMTNLKELAFRFSGLDREGLLWILEMKQLTSLDIYGHLFDSNVEELIYNNLKQLVKLNIKEKPPLNEHVIPLNYSFSW
ncbi:predicted protein [Naegleria gruberi]|uniref:Predicted protein n=1 Tax=Naegleria gruberi TaxID=5762 RepID=D2W6K9_NAEGR|nr:uncharacterized protein NAEGRDRAFT_77053 [Naegleria gruberi]EFC35293.1 predicted protein [Naegleria gruberi]|eukprot:XP_002668037.1 predicted protein [Naegleria gruberi strain NEG-M]